MLIIGMLIVGSMLIGVCISVSGVVSMIMMVIMMNV